MSRVRIRYQVGRELAFFSHLDRWRTLSRTVRRADLPIVYSQGFHPRPHLAMGPPLPVGAMGQEELCDLFLGDPPDPASESNVTPSELIRRLNTSAPPGLTVDCAWLVREGEKSLGACSYRARWLLLGTWSRLPPADLLPGLLEACTLTLHRVTPKGSKDINVRPYLLELAASPSSLELSLLVSPQGGVRLEEVLRLIAERGSALTLLGVCRVALQPLEPESTVFQGSADCS